MRNQVRDALDRIWTELQKDAGLFACDGIQGVYDINTLTHLVGPLTPVEVMAKVVVFEEEKSGLKSFAQNVRGGVMAVLYENGSDGATYTVDRAIEIAEAFKVLGFKNARYLPFFQDKAK